VLGAQACVWTEFITTTDHLESMVQRRMAALAEVLWSGQREGKSTIVIDLINTRTTDIVEDL
jgi:N-acetyl-beta-hexosaminidase